MYIRRVGFLYHSVSPDVNPFWCDFVALALRPERSEGAARSAASCAGAEKTHQKFAAMGVAASSRYIWGLRLPNEESERYLL